MYPHALAPSAGLARAEEANMKQVTEALALIMNLRAAADAHKAACHGSKCNVSLGGLERAADLLLPQVAWHEAPEARDLLTDWPR
jgi:hypothetical protein